MLGSVVEGLKDECPDSVVNKIYLMSQDPLSEVRKAMCKPLEKVLFALDIERIERNIVEKVLDLSTD